MQKDRDLKTVLDQQAGELDKLGSHVNSIEAEMLRVKKEFEYQVEQRNYTGMQLIERNDELCIHYEKLNVQETVSARGKAQLAQRKEELRTLEIEAQELLRSVAAKEKDVPRIAQLLKQLEEKQQALAGLKKETASLSLQLGLWVSFVGFC